MIEFIIESVDKNGIRSEEDHAVAWLIKEGDTLHCTCSSKEAARYARQYFVNLNLEKAFLKDQKYREEFEFRGHKFIVETKLALEAVKLVESCLDMMETVPKTQTLSSPTKTPGPRKPIVPTEKHKG